MAPALGVIGFSKDHEEGEMADRRVTATGKDRDGDITSVCDDGQYWSPRYKADAIQDIESKAHTYFVNASGHRTDIH